jgi:hypothetical protein
MALHTKKLQDFIDVHQFWNHKTDRPMVKKLAPNSENALLYKR